MLHIVPYCLRLSQEFLANHLSRWRAFRRHGVFVPSGALIHNSDVIRIGESFGISPGCRVLCQDPERGSTLSIGHRVKLNFGVTINADCGGRISIGNDVLLANNVVIRAANHRFGDPDSTIASQGHSPGLILIEDDVWIGANTVVLPNVQIGRGAIIGAGSVVTQDIPPLAIAVGVPARVIGKRGERGDRSSTQISEGFRL